MSIRNCVAIVNPHGGTRRGLSALDELSRSLSDAGVVFDSHVTQHAEHAIELAREVSLADYDCFCVVGGDGTVHDVVGGLMLRDDGLDIPIALVPAGTGNTLHQDLNCSNLGRAAEAILGGKTRWLDIVEVKSLGQVTYCVNIIGWGGMADINVKAEKLRMLGPSRYALASFWQIMQPIHRHAKLCANVHNQARRASRACPQMSVTRIASPAFAAAELRLTGERSCRRIGKW